MIIYPYTKLLFHLSAFLVIFVFSGSSEDYQSYLRLLTTDTSLVALKEPIIYFFLWLGNVTTPVLSLNFWSAINILLLLCIPKFAKLGRFETILFVFLAVSLLSFQSLNQLRSSTAIAICSITLLTSYNKTIKVIIFGVVTVLIHNICILYIPFLYFISLPNKVKIISYVIGISITPFFVIIIRTILENTNIVYKRYLEEGWLEANLDVSLITILYVAIGIIISLGKSEYKNAQLYQSSVYFCIVFKIYSLYAPIIGRLASLFEIIFWLSFSTFIFNTMKSRNMRKFSLIFFATITFLLCLFLSSTKDQYLEFNHCIFSENKGCST